MRYRHRRESHFPRPAPSQEFVGQLCGELLPEFPCLELRRVGLPVGVEAKDNVVWRDPYIKIALIVKVNDLVRRVGWHFLC